jgi:ribonuclease HI
MNLRRQRKNWQTRSERVERQPRVASADELKDDTKQVKFVKVARHPGHREKHSMTAEQILAVQEFLSEHRG